MSQATNQPSEINLFVEGNNDSLLSDAAQIVLFIYCPASGSVSWISPNAEEILGIPTAQLHAHGDIFLRFVHADERFDVEERLENCFNGGGRYNVTYRWQRPDTEEVRLFHCRGHLTSADGGDDLVFVGCIADVTEIGSSAAFNNGFFALKPFLAALPGAHLVLDQDLQIMGFSSNFPLEHLSFGLPIRMANPPKIGHRLVEIFGDERECRDLLEWCEGALYSIEPAPTRTWRHGEETFQSQASAVSLAVGRKCLVISIAEISAQQKLTDLQQAHFALQSSRQLERGVFRYVSSNLQLISTHANLLEPITNAEPLAQTLATQIQDLALEGGHLLGSIIEDRSLGTLPSITCDLNSELFEALKRTDLPRLLGSRLSLALGRVPFSNLSHQNLQELLRVTLRFIQDLVTADSRPFAVAFRTQTHHHSPRPGDISSTFCGLCVTIRPYSSSVNDHLNTLGTVWNKLDCALMLNDVGDGSLALTGLIPALGRTSVRKPRSSAESFGETSVLAVSDDPLFLDTMERNVAVCGAQLIPCLDHTEVKTVLERCHPCPKLVLLDDSWGIDSLRLLWKRLKAVAPDLLGLALHSANRTEALLLSRSGLTMVLQKPVESWRIKAAINHLLHLGALADPRPHNESIPSAANGS